MPRNSIGLNDLPKEMVFTCIARHLDRKSMQKVRMLSSSFNDPDLMFQVKFIDFLQNNMPFGPGARWQLFGELFNEMQVADIDQHVISEQSLYWKLCDYLLRTRSFPTTAVCFVALFSLLYVPQRFASVLDQQLKHMVSVYNEMGEATVWPYTVFELEHGYAVHMIPTPSNGAGVYCCLQVCILSPSACGFGAPRVNYKKGCMGDMTIELDFPCRKGRVKLRPNRQTGYLLDPLTVDVSDAHQKKNMTISSQSHA